MAQKNKVTIFSQPEEIDNFIKAKLEQMPRRGGSGSSIKNSWSDEEIELRDQVIMDYITSQGLSKDRTAQQIQSRWGLALSTAKAWVGGACKRFCTSFPEDTQEEQRKMWMERCEQILQEAIDTRDKKNALRALDLMGKSMGIYRETQDLNIEGENTIHFDFS